MKKIDSGWKLAFWVGMVLLVLGVVFESRIRDNREEIEKCKITEEANKVELNNFRQDFQADLQKIQTANEDFVVTAFEILGEELSKTKAKLQDADELLWQEHRKLYFDFKNHRHMKGMYSLPTTK